MKTSLKPKIIFGNSDDESEVMSRFQTNQQMIHQICQDQFRHPIRGRVVEKPYTTSFSIPRGASQLRRPVSTARLSNALQKTSETSQNCHMIEVETSNNGETSVVIDIGSTGVSDRSSPTRLTIGSQNVFVQPESIGYSPQSNTGTALRSNILRNLRHNNNEKHSSQNSQFHLQQNVDENDQNGQLLIDDQQKSLQYPISSNSTPFSTPPYHSDDASRPQSNYNQNNGNLFTNPHQQHFNNDSDLIEMNSRLNPKILNQKTQNSTQLDLNSHSFLNSSRPPSSSTTLNPTETPDSVLIRMKKLQDRLFKNVNSPPTTTNNGSLLTALLNSDNKSRLNYHQQLTTRSYSIPLSNDGNQILNDGVMPLKPNNSFIRGEPPHDSISAMNHSSTSGLPLNRRESLGHEKGGEEQIIHDEANSFSVVHTTFECQNEKVINESAMLNHQEVKGEDNFNLLLLKLQNDVNELNSIAKQLIFEESTFTEKEYNFCEGCDIDSKLHELNSIINDFKPLKLM